MLDRFKVRMWDKESKKMWFFENDFLLETVFECLKQQLANEPTLEEFASYIRLSLILRWNG